MHRPMPPLRALVAFEASVRHASFKQAADELHITPGAVSQQVQKLEQWLGYPLFLRQVRQLQVTDRGMKYFSRIAPALEQISAASEASRKRSSDSVCLSLSQTLAAKWLGPRLGDFVSRYPAIEVHINASNTRVDFQREAVDLAIRHFDGKDPALDAHLIFDDEVRLLCSPSYRDSFELECADQLSGVTLIVASPYPYWDDWLTRFTTIDAPARKQITTMHFDQTLLAIDAAKRGQGVVLSNGLLVQEELVRGELVEPFSYRLPLDKSYYLVYPRHPPLSDTACILKNWLLEQSSNVNMDGII
ncbi:LysR substrate-binding domain-containing protein [Neptunomonas qingdaonensis]|uniref:DNA-binding transcriptional regulator, LysR family n=1 Tax=Neptunomonas qingdaonensis TaxID=1045558 RepID=A0A1I2S6U5_9GAMM|nr:LysR substrate-binding domain-containing protein [Neptunomonas qingdaonensis]SFG48615.1 DNA-binding transcriptional regulator, LysR family [Neptunomonas qingdaonensis]